jgi:O-antigen/teichoic acid export membrane protein
VLWRVRGFAGGIAASSLLAFVLTQIDKVLLSRLLTLAEFGTYVLAAALACATLGGP